jgi:hypothetical protein
MVDKMPLTHSDAQRVKLGRDRQGLRRSPEGYWLSANSWLRLLAPSMRSRRIDRPETLNRVSNEELGRLLGVDGSSREPCSTTKATTLGWRPEDDCLRGEKIVSTNNYKELVDAR